MSAYGEKGEFVKKGHGVSIVGFEGVRCCGEVGLAG